MRIPPNRPLLSVVIPTKNRHETLSVLIAYLLSWDSLEVEVVVNDNSDNAIDPTSWGKVSRVNLIYNYDREKLSAIENCDRAVSLASGEYLSFLGDDDAATPSILKVVKWMKKHQIDCLVPNCGTYNWPDLQHAVKLNNRLNGRLFSPRTFGSATVLSPTNELKYVLATGGQTLAKMPRLYHALAAKSLVDRIRNKYGTVFPGPVPDMSNAVVMSRLNPKTVSFPYPVIISGISSKSMAGRNSRRDHQGEISKEPSIPKEAECNWTKQIPKYWSGPTIWAEAAHKAATNDDKTFAYSPVALARIYANCVSFNKINYWPKVAEAFLEAKPRNWPAIVIYFLLFLISIQFQRTKILLSKLFISPDIERFEDIRGAAMHIEERHANDVDNTINVAPKANVNML
jgi:glycosyltransferase involved in cell wall biosynthesis